MTGAVNATEVASKRANWVKRNIIINCSNLFDERIEDDQTICERAKQQEESSFETEKIRGDGTSSLSIKAPGFSIVSHEPTQQWYECLRTV